MNLLHWGYVAVAAACGTVAIQHLLVAFRLRERVVPVLFALTSLAAGVDALAQRRILSSPTPEFAEAWLTWSALTICSFLGLLVWFIAARTGSVRRWLLWVVTALLAMTALIGFVVPEGVSPFLHVEGIREVTLAWGEPIRKPVGTAPSLRLLGDAANVALLTLLIDTTIRLARRSRLREALLIGGSLIVLGLSVLAIIPADLGWIEIPSLHPFAFLLIVAGMSWDLSDEVARAARLSREVARGESRWRQLVENAPLSMAIVGRDGRMSWVNAHYERSTGWRAAEVLGRRFSGLVAEDERERAEAAFQNALAGEAAENFEGALVTAAGEIKIFAWRSFLLRDDEGEPEAILSLGADVTQKKEAERSRDEALHELERSVRDLENLKVRLEEENLVLREAVTHDVSETSLIGSSPALMYVLHKVQHVAPTGATVLLTGETGVGKELVARLIHKESERSSGPFVAVNCAALPPTLIESELFGHERGAFTGADRLRRGRFEAASGGTLFLDEVPDLPLGMQPKLLRVLQEGQIERVGGERTLDVNVRLIAATNRDLRGEVDAGRFREDLFYRLDVYPITIPPLRDRSEDIPALVTHFARQIAAREGIRVSEIPPEVLRHLAQHRWPGNVRELRNVVERAVLRCEDGVLRLTEPLVNRAAFAAPGNGRAAALRPTLAEVQRDYIRKVLEECGGRIAGPGGAAEVLGVHPNTLRSRMQKLGIAPRGPSRAEDVPPIQH